MPIDVQPPHRRDPIAIVGMACRLPGCHDVDEFANLLFAGRGAIDELPADRFDRELYFDSRKGTRGKSYTTLGGIVPEPAHRDCGLSQERMELVDPAHLNFCDVAVNAWTNAGLSSSDPDWDNTGVYVGHSGGTKLGGPLALATQVAEVIDLLHDVESFSVLDRQSQLQIIQQVTDAIRSRRPRRSPTACPRYNAYYAAALASEALGLSGPRNVVDGACASSLLALNHAILALDDDRIDAAIVGGATYNNVDNLILFSHSQACSDSGTRPFDESANGLVSSEGYVAIVVTRLSRAVKFKLPVLGVIDAVGISSDGRGRSLWAPRRQGQELAIRRAYAGGNLLAIDYLEAHATSTQLGDATELQTISSLNGERQRSPLPIGSVKSNIGHTLEAAGIVGLVKTLLAMREGVLPPSINIQQLDEEVDRAADHVRVVTHKQPWPRNGDQKHAGISAFGIGGLNAHLHVHEWDGIATSDGASDERSKSPIAIVGRGLVLPGAANVVEYAELLKSGRSVISDPPEDRWRNRIGVDGTRQPHGYHAPTSRGGYVRRFEFDGQKYRIPPKQAQQANPIQLMLLEAVTQAARECSDQEWPIDRQRTGVVIGTVFGGEFGNQLQAGLRLPEITREIVKAALERGMSQIDAESMAEAYRETMLRARPALFDETGSFTASTLASRIAKTFDLMGGACAVDADDASSLTAMSIAMDQLHSRQLDMVVCGTAQRAMDLCAFEDLDLTGRLVRSGRPEDVPGDCSRVLPGEGVVVLMLSRLDDAVAAGLPVFGVINDLKSTTREPGRCDLASDPRNAEIVRQIGYLVGSHSLVRIATATLDWSNSQQPENGGALVVVASATDGFTLTARVSPDPRTSNIEPAAEAGKPDALIPQSPPPPSRQTGTAFAAISSSMTSDPQQLQTATLGASTPEEFLRALDDAIREPQRINGSRSVPFQRAQTIRASVLYDTRESLTASLVTVRQQFHEGRRRIVLDRERAVLWTQTDASPRLGWLFPGQGSQYSGRPAAIDEQADARQSLEQFDGILESMGCDPLSPFLDDPDSQLGRNVWLTQAWMLGMTTAYAHAAVALGRRPDFVLGHSFGEYAAAVTAGCMSLPQAARFAKYRGDAVMMHTRTRGVLLSVRGPLSVVSAALRDADPSLCISHYNSPTQTVIAGPQEAVERFRQMLSQRKLASMIIPVPAPFHTQLLADAQRVFERASIGERLLPPGCGFLSATSAEFLAEPDAIRNSLVTQLTHPVLYEPVVQRLLDADCRLLIEVGPNDVLTRLTREIVGDNALCLSLDVPGRSWNERDLLARATLACVFDEPVEQVRLAHQGSMTSNASLSRNTTAPAASGPEIVDVRKRHRRPERSAASTVAESASVRVTTPAPVVRVAHSDSNTQTLTAETSNADTAAVRDYLVSLVIELTGYSEDVVDFEADLEADLGLDSIKKAQIVGELAEWAELRVAPENLRLDDIRTLGDAADLVTQLTSATPAEAAIDESSATSALPTGGVTSADSDSDPSARMLEDLLIEFVVDLTGYSRDIVDLDADLEADLGLDSIKKAQIIGELQEQFSLGHLKAENVTLGDFRTLRSIQEFLLQEISVREEGSDLVEDDAPQPPAVRPSTDSRNGSASTQSLASDASHTAALPESRLAASHGVEPQDALEGEWADVFRILTNGSDVDAAWRRGYERGQQHRDVIRAALRTLVDRRQQAVAEIHWHPTAEQELAGLSSGAGVAYESVRFAAGLVGGHCATSTLTTPSRPSGGIGNGGNGDTGEETSSASDQTETPESGTGRFALRVVDAPHREGMPQEPELAGPSLIVGSGTLAKALAERIRQQGFQAHTLPSCESLGDVEAALEKVWQHGLTPHLFLVTAHDADAQKVIDARAWRQRREAALQVPFRVCQLWMQRLIEAGQMEDASVVAVSNLGGDFGFSGDHVGSFEGIGALVKAMLIECWMRGCRATPMKVVDISPRTSDEQAVDGILRELAVPSYDMEVSVDGPTRRCVQAVRKPLIKDQPIARPQTSRPLTRGGVWVVSGGGRGITAMTAMALAERHDLRLHLLGTAPVPNVSKEQRKAAAVSRSALRREVTRAASAAGRNPVDEWRNTEKAIEIDITLQECLNRGIEAVYHCCDVSDVDAVSKVLNEIRRTDGPIRGVLHGAGAGQDSRFERKRPDKVEKCLQAKIDGCLALMDATRKDALEWFVTYGSISGRFGANGHTDYSLANDMMAKIVDRYRSERPDVASLTFHWHAWGDVGMATKPEARLALEMIDMQFMPAEDGVAHFLNEFEFGGDEPEVLITDDSYYRKFFPAERVAEQSSSAEFPLPLLTGSHPRPAPQPGPFRLTLDPTSDKFLTQHKVGGQPTLPFVVALECMAEAARWAAGRDCIVQARNVRASQAIKFATERPLEIRLQVDDNRQNGSESHVRLLADVRRRDGRIVENDRTYFDGQFETSVELPTQVGTVPDTSNLTWTAIDYLGPEAPIYHGPELQGLRRIAISGDEAYGKIAASAPVQLFGHNRTRGWTVPCAAMDACLYAVAVFAWQRFGVPSLPVQFDRLQFARQPDPGEPCLVQIRFVEETSSGAAFDFALTGHNGDRLLQADGYHLAWLR